MTNREYLEKNFKNSVNINKCDHTVSWGSNSCLQFMNNTKLENWLDSECSIEYIDLTEEYKGLRKNIFISVDDLFVIQHALSYYYDRMSDRTDLEDALEIANGYIKNAINSSYGYNNPEYSSKEEHTGRYEWSKGDYDVEDVIIKQIKEKFKRLK